MFCVPHTNKVGHQCFNSSSMEMQPYLSPHPHSFSLISATRHALSFSNFKPLSHHAPPFPFLQPNNTRFTHHDPSNDTLLIDLRLKCVKVELARRMFDEIPERDVAKWSAMVVNFANNGLHREALEYTRLMIREGIKQNLVIMKVILKVIGEVRDRKLGREIHGFLVKNRLFYKELSVLSALINMYHKCGDFGSGSRILYSAMERNNGSWVGLMSGKLEVAMRSMIRLKRYWPGVVTVASLLPMCAELRALKQGKEIHAYALKRCFLPHVSIVSSLMVLYTKCGVIEYSMRLFDGMEQRNVILWTAMIDSFVENGCFYEALGVIRSMQSTEHRPDTVTMARMLRVCAELKLVKHGKEVHGQVLKRGFASVHYVAAELIDMYGNCGVVDKAKLVFSVVPVKGSMTWSALIRAYGCKQWYGEAIELFDHMIANGCCPNRFTFEAVLSICDRAGFVEDAFRVFNLMSIYKIEASKEHCTIMIRLLTRYGKLDEALRFLEMSSSSL
ncbi:hypothetical protein RJT34_22348 [Clitoria ternatea]|uniref:Pentatricopeptide repeat-containing protein n=1 Tax=Clitoria ternatea TaxID=43366 RepID=A0AAN9IVK6_CLITE